MIHGGQDCSFDTAPDTFQQQWHSLYLHPILPSLFYLQRAEEHSGMTERLADEIRNHQRKVYHIMNDLAIHTAQFLYLIQSYILN